MHEHTATKTRTQPFNGPVATLEHHRCPSADGNITEVEECACGATRRHNINGRHVESGPWVEAPMQYLRNKGTGEEYLVTYRPSDAVLVTAYHAVSDGGEARIDTSRFALPARMLPAGALDLLRANGYRVAPAPSARMQSCISEARS